METTSGKKLRILYLIKMLQEESDVEHPIAMTKILDRLSDYGIKAERKSIYDDVEQLRQIGLPIKNIRGKAGNGYYLENRRYSMMELQEIVDALWASKFISEERVRTIIEKLMQETDCYHTHLLKREVYQKNRVGEANLSVFRALEELHKGISANVQVQFQYLEWTTQKILKLKKNGEFYRVSPYQICLMGEEYYLIAYDDNLDRIRHFHVNKMTSVSALEEKRTGLYAWTQLDLDAYLGQQFEQIGQHTEKVRLLFDKSCIEKVVDRFGREAKIWAKDDDRFYLEMEFEIIDTFYEMIASFGKKVQILEPENVREAFLKYLSEIREQYNRSSEK